MQYKLYFFLAENTHEMVIKNWFKILQIRPSIWLSEGKLPVLWRLRKTGNNQERQNISRSRKENTLMICKLKNSKKISDVCTWLQDSKGKYYQKKKKGTKKKGEGGKQNKITDTSSCRRFTKRKLLYKKKELISYCKVLSWQ